MVPAPQVSVRPYPWPTGQQKHTFMKRCVAAESGAPPESNTRVRPPSRERTFLNTSLDEKRRKEILTFKYFLRVQAANATVTSCLHTCHTVVCCILWRAAPVCSCMPEWKAFAEHSSSPQPWSSRSYRYGPWSPEVRRRDRVKRKRALISKRKQ